MAYPQQTWTDGAGVDPAAFTTGAAYATALLSAAQQNKLSGIPQLTAPRLAHIEAGIADAATVADTAASNAASVRADLTSLINTVNAQAALLTQLQASAGAGSAGGAGVVYGTNVDATNLPDGTLVVLLSADPTTV